MAPSEWIARRTVWGALEVGSGVDECLRERPPARPRHRTRPAAGVDTISRMFGASVINDGAAMIQLDVPHTVARDADVPVSVRVSWPLILTKAVARLHLIADGNRVPLLTSIPLIPDMVPPHVCVKVRLDDATDVRAVVECGDGTLLQVKRWVSVMPADPDEHADGGATRDCP